MDHKILGIVLIVLVSSAVPITRSLSIQRRAQAVETALDDRELEPAGLFLYDEDDQNGSVPCSKVRDYPPSERCQFIDNTTSCHVDGGFINYLKLPYCSLYNHEWAGLLIILLWLFYLFFALSVVVDNCLCPCLKKITDVLHLGEDVAGVTFLALGNGAADIFSLLLLVLRGEDDDTTDEAGMGSILGGGMFVVSISAGLIAFNYPLKVEATSMLRNVFFYFAAVLWLTFMLWDGMIHIGESTGFIVLYVLYVFVVWIGHKRSAMKLKKKQGKEKANERTPLLHERNANLRRPRSYTNREQVTCLTPTPEEQEDAISSSQSQADIPHPEERVAVSGRGLQGSVYDAALLKTDTLGDLSLSLEEDLKKEDEGLKDVEVISPKAPSPTPPSKPANGVAQEYEKSLTDDEKLQSKPPEQGLGKIFWPEEFRKVRKNKHKWYEVCHASLAYPITVAVALTSPTVDPEKPHGGWNKHLAVVAVLTLPAFATLAFDAFFHEVHEDVFLGPIMAGVGVLLALVVAIFTETHRAPRGQAVFAFLGFGMSICWIYLLANEVVNIVVAFAVALKMTGALLGLILIAAGNSICDLIANFFVARRGKALTGFAASFGSPLLNMLIGVGMATTAAIIQKGGSYPLSFPPLLRLGSGFLCSSLLLTTVLVAGNRWKAGRLLGVSLIVLYVAFLIAAFCFEFIP